MLVVPTGNLEHLKPGHPGQARVLTHKHTTNSTSPHKHVNTTNILSQSDQKNRMKRPVEHHVDPSLCF